MLSLYRGLSAGILAAVVAALCVVPSGVGAQDKKDTKDKDAKKEVADRVVGFSTSDGLSIKGYFFQGNALDKTRPDAVIMMPAPGSKINDNWIWMAKALSEKNFSVLLFDWRGCGLNGPAGVGQGSAIIEDKTKFWEEAYNGKLLKKSQNTVERNGLEYSRLSVLSDSQGTYRNFMFFNDLQGARLFIDKQSDAGKCNSNRVWIISEKDGAYLGLSFIAAEFQRNTIYDPKNNIFDTNLQFRNAGKDYAGIMALSASTGGAGGGVAHKMMGAALPTTGANQYVKDGLEHLRDRLAMVMMYKKGDNSGSNFLLNRVGVSPSLPEKDLKDKFKYPKEFDIKAKAAVGGVDMIDANDSFGVRDFVVKAMVEISKKQPFGKDPTDREAAKMIITPRFPIEKFISR